MIDTDDVLVRLAKLRPDADRTRAEWDQPGTRDRVLASRPRRARPGRPTAVVLSAAAVAALLAAGAVAVLPDSDNAPIHVGSLRTIFVPSTIVDTPRVGPGQFGYREVTTWDGTSESPTVLGSARIWVAPDGSQYYEEFYSNPEHAPGIVNPTCQYRHPPGTPKLGMMAQGVFDEMPTDPDALDAWLRARVSGSSSQDGAMFVSIDDSLREFDLLATSTLRAAWVSVLSRIPRVTVHEDTTDFLDRPAIRLDFTDHANSHGSVMSLLFDPTTFQLVEETSAAISQPRYDGPSPAYDLHLSEQATPTDLEFPYAAVMTHESVVDSVPADVLDCVAAQN